MDIAQKYRQTHYLKTNESLQIETKMLPQSRLRDVVTKIKYFIVENLNFLIENLTLGKIKNLHFF